jgi:hypothetical protein
MIIPYNHQPAGVLISAHASSEKEFAISKILGSEMPKSS